MTRHDDATDASSGDGSSRLPSPAALLGMCARAIVTLWDLAYDWWRLIPEGGYAEDRRLGVWSETVYFPRRNRPIDVEVSSVTTVAGAVVRGADVVVSPTSVEPDEGQGNKELEVLVRRLPAGYGEQFVLTLCDRDDQSFARRYDLDFGVPGTAV